jgi:hypothetical protein
MQNPPSLIVHWEGLAPELRARADVAGSGELLWPLDAARDVIRWLAREGFGILGGEVYAGFGQARGMFRAEWHTSPQWRSDEEWAEFVLRAGDQSARSLERESAAVATESARFFLAVSTETEYPAFLRDD